MKVPFHKPSIGDDEIQAVSRVLSAGWLTTGPICKQFEREFADNVGVSHAVALNSCTAALHLALEAVGLGKGQCIITTPMTFAATAEVAYYFGAEAIFADIEPTTMNIAPDAIEKALAAAKKRGLTPRALIPVHYAGLPCDMDVIMDIARNNDIAVIEDAAHAMPCSYNGRPIGGIGDITCFSFYATKTMTTGEGGMATTNVDKYAERMRKMSLHGISKDAWKRYSAEGSWYYEVEAPGYKYNMTDVAASMGIVQLGKAMQMRQMRAQIAARYNKAFGCVAQIELPIERDNCMHSWHLYVTKLNLHALTIDRARFIEELNALGIGASVHFIPLHLQPFYRNTYGYSPDDFPNATRLYDRIVSLPIYPSMRDEDVELVIESIKTICLRYSR